jgi:hypothetical protein
MEFTWISFFLCLFFDWGFVGCIGIFWFSLFGFSLFGFSLFGFSLFWLSLFGISKELR